MMNEKGELFSPTVVIDFAAYRIPTRHVREHCNLGGPWGVRLGPRARGSFTQRFRSPEKMPPGMTKASPWEAIQFSGNVLLMGHPASMNTGACLGFSVAANQSWDIAYDHCKASKSILARMERVATERPTDFVKRLRSETVSAARRPLTWQFLLLI